MLVSLNKIANDIRLLTSGPRSGIGEIIIPSNEYWFIYYTQEGKSNQCVAMTMVYFRLLETTQHHCRRYTGTYELNVFKPIIAYNLLQSARLIGDACISFNINCAVGIVPNHINIKRT